MNGLFEKIKLWLYWFSWSDVIIRKCNGRKERDGCSGKFRRCKLVNMETIELNIGDIPITGRMSYLIGNFKIDRDEYWFLTDKERQDLHDKYDVGSKAFSFDPRFAEKYKL